MAFGLSATHYFFLRFNLKVKFQHTVKGKGV